MTNPNDPINANAFDEKTWGIGFDKDQISRINKGLTKREYFASEGSSITWNDAANNAEAKYGRVPTIKEVAEYLAKMKIIYADELIKQLNQ